MAYRSLIVLCLPAALGCTTIPETTTIKVPVPVKCTAAEPNRPVMPTESIDAGDSLDTKVRALIAETEIREGYEDELRAALRACK